MIENSHPSDRNQSQQGDFEDNKNATAEMFFNSTPKVIVKTENKESMKCLRQALTSICFQIFITFLAIFSLFSDDIRTAAFDARADITFDIIHIILISIFMVEIVLSWIAIQEYRFSFFFFLDVISTLSILLDINMITRLIYSNNDSQYSISQLATQSRASRVATRAVRIVKLIRIIRIVKLYKSAVKAAEIKQQLKKKRLQQNRKKQKDLMDREKQTQNRLELKSSQRKKQQNRDILHKRQNLSVRQVEEFQNYEQKEQQGKQNSLFDSQLIQEMSERQSKISKVLSDLTIKKIIILVLLIMFLVPLFDSDSYIDQAQSWDFTVKNIHQLLKQQSTIPISSIKGLINDVIHSHSQLQNFIVYFSTPFVQLPRYQHEQYENLRIQQISSSIQKIDTQQILKLRTDLSIRAGLNHQQDNQIYAVMNYESYNKKQALFSMAKTLFVCIVLIGMLHFFTEDINELIVAPIENMMKQVMEMAKNPQSAATSLIDNTQYQTAIVHNAIVKIGALLSLVFGSAGAQIIGSNIMREGDMDALIDGKKKCAIFGFCDIRNFTEVTQLLQEDIMLFVNKIGQLVHSSVYRYGGSANKNIGEAFLLVWPLPNDSYELNHKTNEIAWKKKNYINIMSDFSVFSFVKMIVKVHKDPAILQYKNDPRLKKGLGNNYQVSMGFGLHIGWAIQGAIGSQYKIDASYLSPNVNMASRLQAATKQYGVDLLISQDLYDLLTPSLQLFCRNIDRVTVKGSAKPIRLYTIDMNIAEITPPKDKKLKQKSADDVIDVEYKRDINLQNLDDDKVNRYNAKDFIKNKKELRQVMFGAKTQDFKRRFEKGLQCYLVGSWGDAHLHLTQALKNGKNDGPTRNLINYMKRFNFVAPESWKNFRPLTQK